MPKKGGETMVLVLIALALLLASLICCIVIIVLCKGSIRGTTPNNVEDDFSFKITLSCNRRRGENPQRK
jgi:hypothetical protein